MDEANDERIEARVRMALRTETRDNPMTITGAQIVARRAAPRAKAGRGHPALRILGRAAAIVALGAAGAVVLDQVQVRPPTTDVAVVLRPAAEGSIAISLMGPDGVDRPLRTLAAPGLKVVDGTWSVSPQGWVALGRPPFAEVTLIDLAVPDRRRTLDHTESVTFGPDGRAWVTSSRLADDLWILDPMTDRRTTIPGSVGRESRLVTADGHGLLQGQGHYARRRMMRWEVLREDGTTSVVVPIARYDVRRVVSPFNGPLEACGWDYSGAFNRAPVCADRVFKVVTVPYLTDPGTVWYGPPPSDDEWPISAQWDGDGGAWIVVQVRDTDGGGFAELRHLPAPGEQVTVLRFDGIWPMSLPAFSEDGRMVAFQSDGLDTDPHRAVIGDLETGSTFAVDGIVGGFVSPEVAARLLGDPTPE